MIDSQRSNVIIENLIREYSDKLSGQKEAFIILAAGHGKRIKSNISKMLHSIWGKPTVLRVFDAGKRGLDDAVGVIVVGTKAESVIQTIGKRNGLCYAYQEKQKGTGHAVLCGLKPLMESNFSGNIYVFPGDMGLLDSKTINEFKKQFDNSDLDMLVLSGLYNGSPENNYYGRIIRVPETDINGNPTEDKGKVIEIIEHKDILKLSNDEPYLINFRNRIYSFTKQDLINLREFNSGVYAFKSDSLYELIHEIKDNNAQKEYYITDLISIFNSKGLNVGAVFPEDMSVVLGFNNKSVLKEMEKIAREKAYDKLKDIIDIEDPDDFYICDETIEKILELDKIGVPLDIFIGKGVYIGCGVELNYGVTLKKNVFVEGRVKFGKNVTIWENAHLSCYPNQTLELGDNVEILWGDIIKGNIKIGNFSRIESSVNMTGSDNYPLIIGNNVLIKGTSYLFGSIVEDDLFIEHSVLIKKRIERNQRRDGTVRPVRFYLPMPEGIDSISNID